MAVLTDLGHLYERVAYSPYGRAEHRWAGDVDADGDVDNADAQAVAGAMGSTIGGVNYKADYDLDRDGSIVPSYFDVDDITRVQAQNGKAKLTTGYISGPSDATGPDNQVGYCGYMFNYEDMLYCVRFRHYSPRMGRWLERDPFAGASASASYVYAGDAAPTLVDPLGDEPRVPRDGTWIALTDDVWCRVDKWPVEGGVDFEIHVYKNCKSGCKPRPQDEIFKCTSTGVASKTHRGQRLLLPEELPKGLHPRIEGVRQKFAKRLGRGLVSIAGIVSPCVVMTEFAQTASAATFSRTRMDDLGFKCQCRCRFEVRYDVEPNLLTELLLYDSQSSTCPTVMTNSDFNLGYMYSEDCQSQGGDVAREVVQTTLAADVVRVVSIRCSTEENDCCRDTSHAANRP